ncbi:alpha/beta fold hydrolase [Nocardioides mangrovicus]|uniref:Alpha/beta fold hydrolase n=1 Tax=Nocardioides mangrovicus TaxID=2478913 RepID=A0A3L8P0Q7_9ACTN|nr:alpha/beta fold hydrolase [Nocardioides mangrovicus]RLV49026.1 alpha/beta fold hydrolase [Nocardioides mangrovicus]
MHRVQRLVIHGHERAFVKVGTGPVLLLLHGLGCDHHTWDPIIDRLARRYTVVAPDLLGHGASDKPRADYSIGGYANGMRDLLTVLGIERATVVGHSLGGGVAMQFAYQFPERTERMILLAPGGIGPEVTPLIRAVTLPAFTWAMKVATLPGLRQANVAALQLLARSGIPQTRDLAEVAAIYDSFKDRATRAAIAHVVRACVDWRGQVITMADRAYLTAAMPMCVIWGTEDMVIPASHAEIVRQIAPGAEVDYVANAGHFPHRDHPDRVVKLINDFIRTTEAPEYHRDDWRDMLLGGPVGPVTPARAGDRPLRPVRRPLRRRRPA